MSTRRDSIEPDLEAMMMRAPFAELTGDEQKGVIAALGSPEVYERMRAVLLDARVVLSEEMPSLAPRSGSLDALHRAMAARGERSVARRRSNRLVDLLSYRIPLYQPAAALALLLVIAGVYFAGRWGGERERIVYLPAPRSVESSPVQIDTEAIVQRVVDSLKEEFARSAEPLPARAAGARESRRRSKERDTGDDSVPRISARETDAPRGMISTSNKFVGLDNMPQLDRQRRGKSIAEDSTIGRFRRKMVHDRL